MRNSNGTSRSGGRVARSRFTEESLRAARQRIDDRGVTIRQWAQEKGFPVKSVYEVLGGHRHCYYGRMHDIAVALGLKLGDGHDRLAA